MTDNRYSIDYAKLGTSACKKCKTKIAKGELRIAKITPSPFSEGDTMKVYHHVPCMFDTFLSARATTKIIESSTDLEGWQNISQADRDLVAGEMKRIETARSNKTSGKSPAKKASKAASKPALPSPTKKASAKRAPVSTEDDDESAVEDDDDPVEIKEESKATSTNPVHAPATDDPKHADNSFRQFRGLCTKIADTNGHLAKTAIVEQFITYGTDGESYQGTNRENDDVSASSISRLGNLSLLLHLLLPSKGYKSVTYNLKAKQLCKLFSAIFRMSASEMIQQCEECGGK